MTKNLHGMPFPGNYSIKPDHDHLLVDAGRKVDQQLVHGCRKKVLYPRGANDVFSSCIKTLIKW